MDSGSNVVVVVDDEPGILELICSVLEEEGYDVICLQHPVQTNDLRDHDPKPHLFMLDVMLPDMTGIELARRLRCSGFTDTPMVAMSASEMMLDAANQSKLFHGSLGKPFDIERLLQVVEEHVHTAQDCAGGCISC